MGSKDTVVCIVTDCGGGDWPPLLALASAMVLEGIPVLVVCDPGTLAAVRSAGLAHICLSLEQALGRWFLPAVTALTTGPPGKREPADPLTAWVEHCGTGLAVQLERLNPCLILGSLLGVGLAAYLSRALGIPWCFLNPGCCFSRLDRQAWKRDYSSGGAWMYRNWLLPRVETADLVLHATDARFDLSPEGLPGRHYYVGPLFWEWPGPEDGHDARIPDRSDTGLRNARRVLVTLSTSPQPGDMEMLGHVLKVMDRPDLKVTVTLSGAHDRSLLRQAPDNVRIAGYIPHSRLLPGCDLMVSHAGHGSVMKAMTNGVPMVLIPMGRDQPGVAFRARRLGVAAAVGAKGDGGSSPASLVGRVLDEDREFKALQAAARHQAKRLSKQTPLLSALDHLTQFLLTSGHHE